ncbi:sulfocyanin-like copper-binding protein [Nostoc sp. NIES-2111]
MKMVLLVALSATALSLAGPALAKEKTKGENVNVELIDATVDASLTGANTMKTTLDRETVKAGPVTFHVHNASKSQMHEMVLILVKDPQAALPMDMKEDKVIEDKVKHLGEVADLEPDASGSLKRTLKPGSYLLVCNQPGHYHAGMWATLTVVP